MPGPTSDERIARAVDIGFSYGMINGSRHKQWVIDQMLRALLGDQYAERRQQACLGVDNGAPYYATWDEGVPP